MIVCFGTILCSINEPSSLLTEKEASFKNKKWQGETVMKKTTATIFVLCLLMGLWSCETTQTLETTISSKVSALTGAVDEAVFAQVPAEYLEPVKKAEEERRVYEDRVALAIQKKELADARSKRAGYALDLEEEDKKMADISVDMAKVGAMIEAGVGDREKNEKLLSDLRVKKAKTAADRGNTASKMTGIEESIGRLEREIAFREVPLSEGVPLPRNRYRLPGKNDRIIDQGFMRARPGAGTRSARYDRMTDLRFF